MTYRIPGRNFIIGIAIAAVLGTYLAVARAMQWPVWFW